MHLLFTRSLSVLLLNPGHKEDDTGYADGHDNDRQDDVGVDPDPAHFNLPSTYWAKKCSTTAATNQKALAATPNNPPAMAEAPPRSYRAATAGPKTPTAMQAVEARSRAFASSFQRSFLTRLIQAKNECAFTSAFVSASTSARVL